jgi:hypothetical protein
MTFSIACFLAYFWATYLVPETANVSLEEIDAVFKSSAGVEDAVLKRQVGSLVAFLLLSFGRSENFLLLTFYSVCRSSWS